MKPTGEDAPLKEIPSHFSSIRIKFGVDRQTDKFDTLPEKIPRISLDMVESWTGELVDDIQDGDDISSGLIKFRSGDVLFSKLRPYLAKAFEAEQMGAASPEFLVFRPTNFNAQYLLYLLLSKEFIERVDASTYGAKMPRASWEFIGNLRVPCPHKEKQQEIVDFLDHHVAQIDSLIEQKRQLLDRLC